MPNDNILSHIPSKRCALCNVLEHDNTTIIDNSRFWLCKECKEALKRLVEREKHSMTHERIMKQLENGDI